MAKHWLATLLDEKHRKRRELADFLDLPPPRITEMIKGTRRINFTEAVNIARFFELGVEQVSALAGLSGGERGGGRRVEIVGYVGAGAQVFPIDEHERANFGSVEVPPEVDATGSVALIIRGNSMYPIKDGYKICYTKQHEGVTEDCLGELCVCQTITEDGQLGAIYVKELRRGTDAGRFTLISWNADPIENVQLSWAARVTAIITR